MNRLDVFKRLMIAGSCALAVVAAAAQADDTEIFVGKAQAGVQPNVLFIMDTSGSMSGTVLVEKVPYKASETYSGSCDSSRIYWSGANSTPPTCDSDQWIARTANTCRDIATGVESSAGTALGVTAAQWRETGWGWRTRWEWDRLRSGNHDGWVECGADSGKHGQTDTSTKLYAAHGNDGGPWTSRQRDSISWGRQPEYNFYSANYLNWFHGEGGVIEMTRLEVVQDIANKLVDSLSGVNIGLMRFDNTNRRWNGGPVDLPVTDVADGRERFKSLINGYSHDGNTPLAETMYEAALYLRGGAVDYGRNSGPNPSAPDSYTDVSGTKTYISPIVAECQKNHIVYLTDGEPTQDNDADGKIKALIGKSCTGNCLDELAEFLQTKDQRSTVPGDNIVTTHTVGFFTDQQLLAATAEKGGGDYYTADDYQELQRALNQIFVKILSTSSLFTAPAVSVNAFNRLTHLDQVYFALFQPNPGAYWDGNVKRYRFDPEKRELVDADGDPAVNPANGQFFGNARSWWGGIDGNEVVLGGVANQLSATRNVYTYLGADAPSGEALSSYPLNETNADITGEMLGVGTDETVREKVLKWARGVDVKDEDGDGARDDARRRMGDPLHSKPLLIGYGGTPEVPDITLYAVTNEGYLHAFDTRNGSEYFAFMPKELLPNIATLYNDTSGAKIYGMDGPLSAWVENSGEIAIDTAEGDHVYIYAGMRRGGKSYYALDVTRRGSPKLLWQISGGVPDTDFAELGETWSKPVHSKIKVGGTTKNVLIFGGGYDPRQDAATARSEDTQGRAIFIVDAASGALIWSGGPDSSHDKTFSDMLYSIPSDVRVIDINGDGFADQFYVGDMGGQLWRFDVKFNAESGADLVAGGVIADLNDGTEAGNRRFYYAPDIALVKDRNGMYLSLSVGSGWREHPLDTVVNDRFYMIREHDVTRAPASYTKLGESDLYDATTNEVGQAGDGQQAAVQALSGAEGWYIRLTNSGEKVLAESVTLDGLLTFTTYQPAVEGEVTDGCSPNEGTGRAYMVNVSDATPRMNLDGSEDGTLTAADRAIVLKRSGIPPAPTVLLPGGDPVVLIGTEQPSVPKLAAFGRTFWREQED